MYQQRWRRCPRACPRRWHGATFPALCWPAFRHADLLLWLPPPLLPQSTKKIATILLGVGAGLAGYATIGTIGFFTFLLIGCVRQKRANAQQPTVVYPPVVYPPVYPPAAGQPL